MTKKNKSKRNKELDYFPSLYMMLDDYPVNKYGGFSMPTLQMNFNSGSFWSNPTLGLNLGTLSSILNNVPQLTPPLISPLIPTGTTGKRSLSDKINNMGEFGQMALMSGAGITGNILGNALAGGKTSSIGNTIGTIGSALGGATGSVIGGPLGGIVGSFAGNLMGGVWNSMFGSKMNYENINRIEKELNLGANYNSSANNFEELTLEIMNAPSIGYFSKSDIGSDGLFSNKASRKFRELSARKKFVEDWITRSLANSATNLQLNQLNDLLMGWYAYGGLLDNSFGGGAIDYDLANLQLGIDAVKAMGLNRQYSLPNIRLNTFAKGGKIHIKPENRGKFTALKKRTGKSATWFKKYGTPALRKMATFALNAKKWKHEDGGNLNGNNSNDSNNSLSNKTQGFLDNIGYGDTPLSAIVPEEYKNIADGVWGGLEMFTPLGTAMGVADVANDIRNIYHKGNISSSDLGNLMLDSSGFIPGSKVLKKADAINDTFSIMGNVKNELNKKSFGGDLLTNGTVFSNGTIQINAGGSHSTNPYEGVQMGVDPLGIPNLVEEGETVWNDYVFSNRIPVPNAVRNKYKLRGTKGMSFSDAAKKIQKASEERPNDPIAQDTLDINLTRLALEQEAIRELKNMNNKNTFKSGGPKKSKIPAFTLTIGKDDFIDPRLDKAQLALSNPLGLTKDDFAKVGMVDKDPYANITFNKNNNSSNNNNYATWLRYAPVVGSAIGLGLTLLSSPDYSRADALALYAQNVGKVTPISYDPLGNYLTYRPNDVEYIANKMAALAAATRRGIMNTSGGNRANAIGSLLAADYNALIALADAIRQGEDTNWNRYVLTETYNRGTNQYNSEAALKAAMANQEAKLKASQLGLSGYTTAMQMKDAIDALRNASISANLTNLFDSLGDIGREEVARRMVDESPALLYTSANRYKGNKNAKGGKLNKKKRGGFTY